MHTPGDDRGVYFSCVEGLVLTSRNYGSKDFLKAQKGQSSLQVIEHIAGVIAAVIAAISLLVGVWKYKESIEAAKVEKVMMLERRFNSERLVAVRNRIEDAWLGNNDVCLIYHNESFDAGDPIWVQHQYRVIHGGKLLARDISAVLDFYTALNVCVEHEVCDKETATSFFKPYADGFLVHHMPYICDHGEIMGGPFARGLVNFANSSYDKNVSYDSYLKHNCRIVKNGRKRRASNPEPIPSMECENWYTKKLKIDSL